MQLWTFLHIVSMFTAVMVGYGATLFLVDAIRRGDRPAMRAIFRVWRKVDLIGTFAFILGIVFGLTAAVTGQLNLLQGWLVLAYVLVGAIFVLGFLDVPFLNRLREAVGTGEDDDHAGRALPDARRYYISSAISTVLIVTIIWDMVFKPF
jgi:uncharacterized membrane protein